MVLTLVDTDRLVQKEREVRGSSDGGDAILNCGLEILVKQETLGVVIELKGIDKGLEFGGVGGG